MSMPRPTPSRIATLGVKPIWTYVAVLFLAAGLEAIDLGDCLLHPWGSISIVENFACPTPTLSVSTSFRCEECGNLEPITSISATGSGQCSEIRTCEPILQSISYEVAWMSIVIQNRDIDFFFCHNNGVAISSVYCNCPSCDASPIIISLDNGSLQLTSPEGGVQFDLTADGTPQLTAWTEAGSDDAFLALDRNGNGIIDDGGELFGDHTPQPVSDPADRNGFEALAVFDDSLSGGNEDGFIDEDDDIFSDLQLWTDSNHNGISEVDELLSLSEASVEAIDLSYRSVSRTDAHGNEFRFASKVQMSQGMRIAWDVFLQQGIFTRTVNRNRVRSGMNSCNQHGLSHSSR